MRRASIAFARTYDDIRDAIRVHTAGGDKNAKVKVRSEGVGVPNSEVAGKALLIVKRFGALINPRLAFSSNA